MTEGFDRSAARARCDAATPGPWQYGFTDGSGRCTERDGGEIIGKLDGIEWDEDSASVVDGGRDSWGLRLGVMSDADAEFIAAARSDLPAALDAIDALEAALAKAQETNRTVYRMQSAIDAVLALTDAVVADHACGKASMESRSLALRFRAAALGVSDD